MVNIPYNRSAAVAYAHKWAYDRNRAYYDFSDIGGDCTNFASQCIYAGCGIMNYTPTFGWYYINSGNRSPSWSGVDFLHNFLVKNTSVGPYAMETSVENIMPGDIIQLKLEPSYGSFQHSPVVVEVGNPVNIDNILVAAHSFDADFRPLNTYDWLAIRFLHILGARKWS